MSGLQSISPRDRKILLYGFFATAVVLLYLFVFEPLWQQYRLYGEKIPQLNGMILRYSELLENRNNNRGTKTGYETSIKRIMSASFIAQTEPLATGQLAQLVREKAGRAGITLNSSKPEKPEPAGKLQLINLSVAFDSQLANLASFIKELENDGKEIRIREARISSQKREYADTEPERLSVKLLITGLRFFPSSTMAVQ
ncbi:MAG: type II secretion system protein GspM [Nitrospinota bacterium]